MPGSFLGSVRNLYALRRQIPVVSLDVGRLETHPRDTGMVQMRVRLTRRRRVHELEQIDSGRIGGVAEAQMHALQIRRPHSERVGHFLAGHAFAEVDDDLEAE